MESSGRWGWSNRKQDRVHIHDLNPNDHLTHANGFLPNELRMLTVVDTATDQVIQQVGPFAERTRPFTINGAATLAFMTVNDLIGFQVGDVRTGKVLFTAGPPADVLVRAPGGQRKFKQPPEWNHATACHGIALTADEQECWTVDQIHIGLHVFDISGLPARAPVWKEFIPTRTGQPDIFGQPGWIVSTIDSRYFYPETCEIIDTREKKVVGQLQGRWQADAQPLRIGSGEARGHGCRGRRSIRLRARAELKDRCGRNADIPVRAARPLRDRNVRVTARFGAPTRRHSPSTPWSRGISSPP